MSYLRDGGLGWVPVLYERAGKGVYIPRQFRVKSVGSSTVHFDGHPDVAIGYVYMTKEMCKERCRELFHIITTLPKTQYPIL